jgi:hypothetical protein
MKVFIVHRGDRRAAAAAFFKALAKRHKIDLWPEFVALTPGDSWKVHASEKIEACEAVLVFDPMSAKQSENVVWEISVANDLNKHVIEFTLGEQNLEAIAKLKSIYDFSEDFEACFSRSSSNREETLELYRIMVASSQELLQRRQLTNGFFITVIGGIVAASGYLVKEDVLAGNSILFLTFPAAVALLLCKSWKNLIENFGKLNTGKFRVINRLEKELSTEIYSAEWLALGNGARPSKYQSFTSTEANVPKYFAYLIVAGVGLILILTDWTSVWNWIWDRLSVFREPMLSVWSWLKTH